MDMTSLPSFYRRPIGILPVAQAASRRRALAKLAPKPKRNAFQRLVRRLAGKAA